MSAGARGGFSVTDFKVPRRYLDMIIRPDSEGGREYVDQPGLADDDYISSLEFMDRCLRHFRKTGYESLANASMVVPFGSFGMIVSSVADSKDFEEAPKRCVAAVEILRPDLVARFVRTKDRLKLDITCKRPATTGMEIGLEFFVLALHTSFRWMTGKSLRPVSVRGAAKINGFDESLLVVLAAPMTRRGTGVTLYYPLDYAGIEILPVKYESWGAQEVPEFLRMMQEAAEARSATDGATAAPVAEQAAELIRQGVVTEAGVAQRMEISAASLRRRLTDAGTSFRQLLSDTRREAVQRLLATDKSLEAIAEEVGYSDERSLRRACVQWFGIPLAQYREEIRKS
ncbi:MULTISPECIES: helix-turn-helix domain-containing protein [unclassified Sphingomonas]|jgi:AraC-like DNA-binding protein|uniref:helix-turn-helix domain-containing protein n=1 Tax=unclassified Sphingomonas TaxID=196159 RepID=UPI00092BDD30|nr:MULTISPECIES: helix-turn-helix domain-containing protein [unclassified Sphingomonas]OJU21784.1 MAG: hypothetical protein BGN95_09000 [Sphingomonas sp. 66-10]